MSQCFADHSPSFGHFTSIPIRDSSSIATLLLSTQLCWGVACLEWPGLPVNTVETNATSHWFWSFLAKRIPAIVSAIKLRKSTKISRSRSDKMRRTKYQSYEGHDDKPNKAVSQTADISGFFFWFLKTRREERRDTQNQRPEASRLNDDTSFSSLFPCFQALISAY